WLVLLIRPTVSVRAGLRNHERQLFQQRDAVPSPPTVSAIRGLVIPHHHGNLKRSQLVHERYPLGVPVNVRVLVLDAVTLKPPLRRHALSANPVGPAVQPYLNHSFPFVDAGDPTPRWEWGPALGVLLCVADGRELAAARRLGPRAALAAPVPLLPAGAGVRVSATL